MATKALRELRVADGKIFLPTERGGITFDARAYGPGTYRRVGRKILNQKLAVLTGDFLARLVNAAYCSAQKDAPEYVNIRNAMKGNWFWAYVQNLWTSKGMYSHVDYNVDGEKKRLSTQQLEAMLEGGKELSWGGIRVSKDEWVRFAPRGSYSFGKHTSSSLAKDGAVIAQYGVRGAELLGEVAEALGKQAVTYGLVIAKIKTPEQRISALSEHGGRLHLFGRDFDNYEDGIAFGVFETGETRPRKGGQHKLVEVKSASGFQPGREHDIEVGKAGTYVHEDEVTGAVNVVESGGKYPPALIEDFKKTLERNLRKE